VLAQLLLHSERSTALPHNAPAQLPMLDNAPFYRTQHIPHELMHKQTGPCTPLLAQMTRAIIYPHLRVAFGQQDKTLYSNLTSPHVLREEVLV